MHWIYHPNQEAKIVSSEEYPIFLREGWFDTPAKFPEKNIDVPHETLEAPRRRGRPPSIKMEEVNDNSG